MKPNEWYKLFLHTRHLFAPSGNPLYSYKIKKQEFYTLTDVLRNNDHESPYWDLCFVIFATEWWRTAYEGGSWCWDPILRYINKTNLSTTDRKQLVASGFKKWKRPINENLKGHDFIGTVVIECGLPLLVLESEHYLTDVITDLYQELGAISSIETEYLELAKTVSAKRRLPLTLQKDAFFHLLLQFVTELVSINTKYGFTGNDKPAEMLDRLSPGWREQFPLRIDDTSGKRFIDQLLTGVSKVQEYQPILIHSTHEIHCSPNGLQLKTFFHVKAGLYKFSDLCISNSEFESLSNKLEIYLGTASGTKRIGFTFKDHEQQGFHLDEIRNHPVPSTKEWSLYLLDPQTYSKIPLTVVDADIFQNGEPMIFEAPASSYTEKIWKLTAFGSARLPNGTYWVLAPKHAELVSGNWKPLDNNTIEEKEFSIHEVTSDIGLEYDDNSYFISFTDETDNFSYEVLPQPNGLEFYQEDNKNIYRGWPKIYKIRPDGIVIGQIATGLEYLQGDRWIKLLPQVIGKTKIRLRVGAAVVFCKTLQILPPDFSVEFNTSEGKVMLINSHYFAVTVYSNTNTIIEKNGNGHAITFTDQHSLPEYFELGLTPKDGDTGKIKLKIPCPKQQLFFYNAAKEQLAYKASLYLHDLYGSRLNISNLSAYAQTYRLKLTLVDAEQREDITVYRSLRVPAYGNLELALVTLKDYMLSLLCMSTNIDARILISCDEKAAIEIRQFEFNLERLPDGCMKMGKVTEEIPPFELQAFRLDEPFNQELVATLFFEEENKQWSLPAGEGLWFIYPAAELKEQFRPMAYKWQKDHDTPPVILPPFDRLHKVALLSRDERLAKMDDILAAMMSDHKHPDWMEIYTLYQSLQHLPLSSQDIFTRITNHNSAMPTAALLIPEDMILRLTREFAIIWPQYPVDEWIKAFKLHHANLAALIPAHADHAVRNKLEWLAHQLGLTAIKWKIEQLVFDSRDNHAQQLNAQVMGFLIAEHLNGGEQKPGLRARHPETKWPDYLRTDIINLHKKLPAEIRALLPGDLLSYQKPVIYMPFVLAAASAQPDQFPLPKLTSLIKFRIREIISFDEVWFNEIYNLIQGFLINR